MNIKVDENTIYDHPGVLPNCVDNRWVLEESGKIRSQNGRLYQVHCITVQHGKERWKISFLLQAMVLTLFSLGFGLTSKNVRKLWKASCTGRLKWKETIRAKVRADLSSHKIIKKIFSDLTISLRQNLSNTNGEGWYWADDVRRGFIKIDGGWWYGKGIIHDFFSMDYKENVVRVAFSNLGASSLSVNSRAFDFDLLQSGKLFIREGMLVKPKESRISFATEEDWDNFEKILSNFYAKN